MVEFTGERVIPGQVDLDLLNEHLARYMFASRLAKRKRVLDAGCGAGGTLYPTTVAGRGSGAASTISINGNVLTFSFQPTPGVPNLEQARVFTLPAPGPVALAAVGGLLAIRRRRSAH